MLEDRLRKWGVNRAYRDWRGVRRNSPAPVLREVLAAIEATAEEPPAPPVVTVFRGEQTRLRGRVRLEQGGELAVGGELPPDVPDGYHSFDDGDSEKLLIMAPATCAPAPRGWGWAVQLYSLRSTDSWGIGDLGDLDRLARWSAGLGATVLVVNPLHAVLPCTPQEASPYYPSSRRYRNPLYLRVQDVPGARATPGFEAALRAGAALNKAPLLERDRVMALKLGFLENVSADTKPSPEFQAYKRREGTGLEAFAIFNVLCERHGPRRRDWPADLNDPQSAGTRRFAAEHRDRIDFHAWLQWLLDLQLQQAGGAVGLVSDLAVGVDPGGADAWLWQDVFAGGVTVGAPPDDFNTAGQSWQLPALDPWKLRAHRYEPFIQTLRSAFRHSAGVRVDHVMGLFRLWWIPPGRGPAEGAYVTYPARDLLAILALESRRAGSFVVGEDLGTVSRTVRTELRKRGVLSYRLLWFEKEAPKGYPEAALAAITTHDLPTIAGLWTGRDLEVQVQAGLRPNDGTTREIRKRLENLAGLEPQADAETAIEAAHRALAKAPSRLLAATLEDATAAAERPNVPGTTDELPNWRRPLPLTLEQLEEADLPRRIAAALAR